MQNSQKPLRNVNYLMVNFTISEITGVCVPFMNIKGDFHFLNDGI
jgi:hypothetical protein